MKNVQLWDTLLQLAKTDSWYKECLKTLEKAEPAFLAIRDSLNETQRRQLDDYIAACEALEDALVLLAFKIGTELPKT